MAAAAVRPPTIDLERSARYPIRLGASIAKPSSSPSYFGIRYNHKSHDDGTEGSKYTITPGKEDQDSSLTVRHGEEEDRYEGQHSKTADSYVLVLKKDGNETCAVLERLSQEHAYNLVASTTEKVEDYPQISLDDNADNLFGEDDAEEPLDPNNPFDYRHFLKAVTDIPRTQKIETKSNTTQTPTVQPRTITSGTPNARPTKRTDAALFATKKRKAPVDSEKPDVKRAKADHKTSSVAREEVAKSKSKTEAPRIRLDRKASIRRPSYDDDGELVLENETPVTEKLPTARSAMSLALSGQLGPGPISLRSAASSPASQVASPMAIRPSNVEEDEGQFEIGGSSPDEETKPRKHVRPQDEENDGNADQEDEDADVDDLELPSPATVHKPSISAVTVTSMDDEDDLDKQLALAMAEEDDGGGTVAVAEDEEESEEE